MAAMAHRNAQELEEGEAGAAAAVAVGQPGQ